MADLKTLVLGRREVADLDTETEMPHELMTVNMGPSHPAMHGTVRIVLTVDGERIVKGDVQPGYLHRCFEKESEYATYTQIFPYTDRLNYVSPMINNVGYALAVPWLGLAVSTALYIGLCGAVLRLPWRLTLAIAVTMSLGLWVVFVKLLKVAFGHGLLF